MTRLVLVLALVSCAHVEPPAPVVVQGCRLDKLPPARPDVRFALCDYEICMDTPNASVWDEYEDELRAWALDAWTRCKR